MITEGKVDTPLGHRYASNFCVDDDLAVARESAFVGGDSVNQFEVVDFGCLCHGQGRVELIHSNGVIVLVVVERKGFLTRESHSWEEVAVSHAELDFDVESFDTIIRSLNERCPQPVVDIVVCNVTHDVGSPMDSLLKVGERFFHPTRSI